MKQALLISALIAVCTSLNAQLPTQIISDTLVIETFEEDPTANMLGIPTGNDPEWVNYDQDGFTGNCVNLNPTPGAWYWEDDFSTDVSVGNSCFTSCSYFHPDPWTDFPCANWLILPPVSIPDSSCLLQWKSLSFQGPAFLDGYQVLISVGSNDVFSNTFKDTLFTAASMVSCPNLTECGSLIVEDYTFTPGYIHANGFTNPDYYFPFSPIQANRGKLEPHQVSLSQYAGKTIYIAFLHDSNNDDILQVDDILVVDQKTTSTGDVAGITRHFSTSPNPASTTLKVEWALLEPASTQLEVRDVSGHLVKVINFPAQQTQQYDMNIDALLPGMFFITLVSENGIATRRFVKI